MIQARRFDKVPDTFGLVSYVTKGKMSNGGKKCDLQVDDWKGFNVVLDIPKCVQKRGRLKAEG